MLEFLAVIEPVAIAMPIVLLATKLQMTFMGDITNKRLGGVLVNNHDYIRHVLKEFLGKEFFWTQHKYRVSFDIPTFFLAMLLFSGMSKQWAKKLTQMLFRHSVLGNIDAAIDNVDKDLHITLTHEYYLSQAHIFPVVTTLQLEVLQARRNVAD